MKNVTFAIFCTLMVFLTTACQKEDINPQAQLVTDAQTVNTPNTDQDIQLRGEEFETWYMCGYEVKVLREKLATGGNQLTMYYDDTDNMVFEGINSEALPSPIQLFIKENFLHNPIRASWKSTSAVGYYTIEFEQEKVAVQMKDNADLVCKGNY